MVVGSGSAAFPRELRVPALCCGHALERLPRHTPGGDEADKCPAVQSTGVFKGEVNGWCLEILFLPKILYS